MKQIFKFLSITLFASLFGCIDDVSVDIPENIDVANITGLTVYNDALTVCATKSVVINNETNTVNVTFNAAQNLAKLKVTLTVSAGSTVTAPLGTSFLDLSQSKSVTIVSPSGKVTNNWTLQFFNP
ncbi:MAG: hypothetical protein LBD53_02330 [Tannerella sp.]|jgi:hypothetical protein|nr:hypothetical protein [Tannerella sp.]